MRIYHFFLKCIRDFMELAGKSSFGWRSFAKPFAFCYNFAVISMILSWKGDHMPPISFLIKPASSDCNLRCRYCFYSSEAEQRNVASYGLMKEETLEAIVKKGLAYADGVCTFAFQGGEPTLAGLPFFRELMSFERKYNDKKIRIFNSIQTNGTLIDEKWSGFFHDNRFLVGLSLDGDGGIHNLHRVDARGGGTCNQVMKAARLLDQHGVEYNILTVVTSNTSRYANRIYEFFKKNGFRYLQFIPCLDPLGEKPGLRPYSLKPAELERFLKQLFDKWYADFVCGDYVSIRYFDNLVQMLLGRDPEACSMAGICRCNCVVEADGGMYPCDFYVLDRWRLGSIVEQDIGEMLRNTAAEAFVKPSAEAAQKCRSCRWRLLCRGGCRRERECSEDGSLGPNYFCSAYSGFLDYAYERLITAARITAALSDGTA